MTLTDATRVGARKAATSRHEARSGRRGGDGSAQRGEGPRRRAKLSVTVTATAWEHGETVTVKATYPYKVDLLGFVVASGNLKSKTTERVE